MAKSYNLEDIGDGDAYISIEENEEDRNNIFVETTAMKTYERHIKDVINRELQKYNVNGLNVYAYDNGALDFVFKNRLYNELVNGGYII